MFTIQQVMIIFISIILEKIWHHYFELNDLFTNGCLSSRAVPKVNVDNGTAPVCYGLSRSDASMFRSG